MGVTLLITQPSSTIASNDGLFQVNILEPINNELRRPGQPLEKVGKAINQANKLFDSMPSLPLPKSDFTQWVVIVIPKSKNDDVKQCDLQFSTNSSYFLRQFEKVLIMGTVKKHKIVHLKALYKWEGGRAPHFKKMKKKNNCLTKV